MAHPVSGIGALAHEVSADITIHTPAEITAPIERVKEAIARRWKQAANAHIDPNARPSEEPQE